MTLIWYGFIALLITAMILVVFSKCSQKHRHRFLILVSLLGVLYYVYNWVSVIYNPRDILIIFPLQLCDLAVFLMPLGLWTLNRKLMDFLFYPCRLGAMAAIILMGLAKEDAFYDMNVNFFFSHAAILTMPYLAVIWGLYDPKPSLGKALRLSIELMILGAIMHGLNLYLAHFYQADAFYFFTIIEIGVIISPILALFAKIIPYDYFYLMCTLPILYLYMALVYAIRKSLISHHHKNSP